MFASNTVEILNYQNNKQERKQNRQDVFTVLLYIHKKLKDIAQRECLIKNKFKVANLAPKELDEVKNLEQKLGYCFVAYGFNKDMENIKKQLLLKIDMLLDEYMKCFEEKSTKNINEEFKDFFEQ